MPLEIPQATLLGELGLLIITIGDKKDKFDQGVLEPMWSLDTNLKRDGYQLLLGSGRDI